MNTAKVYTLDELIVQLQVLSAQGKGAYPVMSAQYSAYGDYPVDGVDVETMKDGTLAVVIGAAAY
jgi:hypothetical protein